MVIVYLLILRHELMQYLLVNCKKNSYDKNTAKHTQSKVKPILIKYNYSIFTTYFYGSL